MIELSQVAAEALFESLQMSGVDPGKGLRLREEEHQFILRLDSPGKNDRAIRHNGAIVLIIDRDTEASIGDAIIDAEDSSGDDPYLVIRSTSMGTAGR